MPPEEKRIVIRVEEERWRCFDDRRHAERTTFQELGLRLFESWLNPETKRLENVESRGNIPESAEITEPESQWTNALITILRSGNDIAAKAIRSNLVAFADYVRAVPDASVKFADIVAKTEELADLDRALDTAKAAAMEGGRTASRDSKKDARGADRKRTSTRAARKSMG